MASLPPQQPQRQSLSSQHNDAPDEAEKQIRRAEISFPSTTSLDSETVLLNDPKYSPAASPRQDPLHEQASSVQARSTPQEDEEPRKCWICFSDETEDTPGSSVWRSPCPCALTAHESCLLDWIADIESPGRSRSTAPPAEIRCPQCKSQIHLARPRSYVVEAVGALEKNASKALLPAFVGGLGYMLLLGCSHHGAHSIRLIFGNTDADRILAPITRLTSVEETLMLYIPSVAGPIVRRWRGLRVELGLPLIPVALVASRTTLADAILPVLPIIFFATHPTASQTLTTKYWPPSAALTFVVLPYIRSAYDEYIERVWGERERGWLKEIKPRLGHEAEQDDQQPAQDAAADLGDDEEIIDIEIGIEFDDGDDAANPQPQEFPPVPALDDPPHDIPMAPERRARAEEIADQIEVAAAQQQQQRRQQEQAAQQPAPHRHQIDLLTTAHRAADTVIGALLFPTVSAASGELLRLLLPLSWTQTAGRRGAAGILQTRWGRSVVGGCLFVVLKDAVRIYCRWRMAVSFRDRRVRDFDKKKGELVR